MPTAERIDMGLVEKIVEEHLVSFKELPGFDGARAGEVVPIYDLDARTPAYYEVKLRGQRGKDNGYVVVSAVDDDLPVVEFSETGKSHAERFRERLGSSKFKMIRFGPGYISAESTRGKLLTGIGEQPTLLSSIPQVRCRGEEGSDRKPTRSTIRARIDPGKPGDLTQAAYESVKRGFTKQRASSTDRRETWAVARSPHSPCSYKYYWADGYHNHPFFLQIEPGRFPNWTDHYSGCGPTAWMNLFGWHDLNWKSSLLPGAPTTNDLIVDSLTMNLHNTLGVFSWFFAPNSGFTWPENMAAAYAFAHFNLKHLYQNYWYRYDYKIPTDFTNYNWVFEVARSYARGKRPFIVGYYQDWHYAIGYSVAECTKHGWTQHSWAKIYPAWLTANYDSANPDLDNKWIPKSTIFGVWAVNNFVPLP